MRNVLLIGLALVISTAATAQSADRCTPEAWEELETRLKGERDQLKKEFELLNKPSMGLPNSHAKLQKVGRDAFLKNDFEAARAED